MTTKLNTAKGSATRTANMKKRHALILKCAGDMIAKEGLEAFTLAKLAERAAVTVPTIHNLIGKKSNIFKILVKEMIGSVELAITSLEVNDPIATAETFIDQLLALYASNEAFYKAAFVIGEKEKMFEHFDKEGIFMTSLSLCAKICINAKQNNFLLGNINPNSLAYGLFGCQRLARQDWVNGYISLDEYRTQVLTGMFITFSADAAPEYKQRLTAKIQELANNTATTQ